MNKEELMKKKYIDLAKDPITAMGNIYDDKIIYNKEVEFIKGFMEFLGKENLTVLDLGCNNGYTLDILVNRPYPVNNYHGIDLIEEAIENAKRRELTKCDFIVGDAREINYEESFFDLVYTQRCLINIPDWEGQKRALNEIRRVLGYNSYYLMIESFTDGLKNNNKARIECGLEPLEQAIHNNYLDKDLFLEFIKDKFEVIELSDFPYNFLSSHFFTARVLHALITKGRQIKNTEFVKFFSYLPPIGNYASLQAYILQKKQ